MCSSSTTLATLPVCGFCELLRLVSSAWSQKTIMYVFIMCSKYQAGIIIVRCDKKSVRRCFFFETEERLGGFALLGESDRNKQAR